MTRAVIAFSILFFVSSVYGYRLNRVAESGARWQDLPVQMTLNPANSGLSEAETQRAIGQAMNTWNSKTNIEMLTISAIDRSLASSDGMDPDAINAIVFSRDFMNDTGFDVNTTVAVGGQYGNGQAMSSAFIIFNAQKVGWGTDSASCKAGYGYCDDLGTISLHELGHVLGLGHSEIAAAAMSATRDYKIKRELHQDDIDGALFLAQYSVSGGSASYSEDQTSGGSGGSGGCGTISTGTGSGTGSGNGAGGTIAMMLLPLLALGVLRNRVVLLTNR